MDDLLADFLTETNEGLAELDAALLRLERAPDDQATLSLVFRVVHTIKGTCGFLGLARLEAVTHAAETVLGRVRDRQLAVTPELISLVLRAADEVKRNRRRPRCRRRRAMRRRRRADCPPARSRRGSPERIGTTRPHAGRASAADR